MHIRTVTKKQRRVSSLVRDPKPDFKTLIYKSIYWQGLINVDLGSTGDNREVILCMTVEEANKLISQLQNAVDEARHFSTE